MKFAAGTPCAPASAAPSPVASIAHASIRLQASLTALACSGALPKRHVFWPIRSNSGCTRAISSSLPPARMFSLPACGDVHAAQHGRRHVADAVLDVQRRHLARERDGHGRHVDVDAAGRHRGQHAAVEQHGARGVVVRQHREHDIGDAAFGGRRGRLRAQRRQRLHGVGAAVPDVHGLAGPQQVGGHVVAHGAQADECDAHVLFLTD